MKTFAKNHYFYLAFGILCVGVAGPGCEDSKKEAETQTGPVTFWKDVAPVLNNKCVKCHQEGGIGGFRLDNYPDAKTHALNALAQIKAGTMPPYFVKHDGTCGDFVADETLTAAEIALIESWATGDPLEGDPVTLTRPTKPTLEGAIDITTPSFSPVARGTQIAEFDEYRCFLMDAFTDKDAFLTGYDVNPGDAEIVHHVLGFVVDPAAKGDGDPRTNAEIMAALDAQSPDRLGWECFGAAGDNVNVSSVPVTWAPGQGVVTYPTGMGVPIAASDKFVVQIHYNMAVPGTGGRTDSTKIQVRMANTVKRQLAFLLPDPFLDSLASDKPDTLEPGKVGVRYKWMQTGARIGLQGVPSADLVAVMPHMHGRGVRQQVQAGAPGQMACISQLDNWNFHWQKFYSYKTYPKITPATQIEVTCDYNTTKDTEPVFPGWGTKNEMCLAVMMVALPESP